MISQEREGKSSDEAGPAFIGELDREAVTLVSALLDHGASWAEASAPEVRERVAALSPDVREIALVFMRDGRSLDEAIMQAGAI